jgi:hypothetical protein
VELPFERYELQARIFPAILLLLPLVILILHEQDEGITLEFGTIITVVALVLAYLAGRIVRARGKRIEPNLFKRWGGMPSAQILRHRDKTFTQPQKLGFHAKLVGKAHCVMPTAEQETNNPAFADQQYTKASDWLRANTRDPARFPIVASENIEYGFYRNTYAVRWIGLSLAIGSGVYILGGIFIASRPNSYDAIIAALKNVSGASWAMLVFDLSWAAMWVTYFSDRRVREAAVRYAKALIEASDAA